MNSLLKKIKFIKPQN